MYLVKVNYKVSCMARKNMSIPLNSTEKQKIVDAAIVESQHTRTTIVPTVLARNLIMAGVELILAENPAEWQGSHEQT